jgi:DNA repair protein RecO (recombination protein O)
MALGRTPAVVIGSFPLGESDRAVTFFSRHQGRIRGVARAARRVRSRFSGALELLTLGELVFFDTGRSDLVRVDHFDVLHPFAGVREDLERLGQAAWMVECVGRLTADRDPHPVVYGTLLRALRSVEDGAPPRRVAVVFGVRLVEALGHRLRTDACVACGRRGVDGRLAAIDVEAGGTICERCGPGTPGILTLARSSLAILRRLRTMGWEEATAGRLGGAEDELRDLLDRQVAHLSGQAPRTTRVLREMERFPVTIVVRVPGEGR